MLKSLKRRLVLALVVLLTIGMMGAVFTNCKKEDDSGGNGAGLLLLLGLRPQTQTSGFFIMIPEGVAK